MGHQRILTCPDPTKWLDHIIRFCVEVDAPSWLVGGCWLWQGHLTGQGYGSFSIRDGGVKWATGAHRAAWLAFRSDIPDPLLEVDHLCRNRQCANPWHLELVTRAENNRRRTLKPKERACGKHGRADGYERPNFTTGYLQWECRICARRYRRRYLDRNTAAVGTQRKLP